MNFKRILAVLVTAVMLCSLTACKKAGDLSSGSDFSDMQNASVLSSGESEGLSGEDKDSNQSTGGNKSDNTTSGASKTPTAGTGTGTGNSSKHAGTVTGNENQEPEAPLQTAVSFTREQASPDVPVQDLSNSYYKLTNNKSLRVGYLGGSVTVGVGADNKSNCWRARTTAWLKQTYPGTAITEIYAGAAGTGSGYGTSRVYRDLLSQNPDLVFVEFVCNDKYQQYSPEESGYYLECLLNEIYSSSKYIDVVLVLITDRSSYGSDNDFTIMYKTIAKHYGIQVVDVGAALKSAVESAGDGWDNYLRDSVHPLDKGYGLYFETVRDFLMSQLVSGSYQEKSLPSGRYMKYVSSSVDTLYPEKMKFIENNGFVLKRNMHNSLWGKNVGVYVSENAGDNATMNFSGVGLLVDFYESTSMCKHVRFIVDGKQVSELSTCIDGPERQTKAIFQGLSSGNHTLKIINVSGGTLEIASFTQLN